MISDSTICAISTAPGNAAIAVIRISGSDAMKICSRVFRPMKGKVAPDQIKPNNAILGTIKDKDEEIDQVLATYFKSPHSYTGEDIVEIACHGSTYIQKRIIKLLLENGAILAQPGEFTLRAFMNGKMDLAQAEGVADLIASSSKAEHEIALNQMKGGVTKQILDLRQKLLNFASLVELELDFSEEDVEFANREELTVQINDAEQLLEKMVTSFDMGNAIKNGIPVAIIGRPNVGKSTLLNKLLNEEKAIVSDIPGTTRDVIEDVIILEGTQYRFIDTAGIRQAGDTIETIGIERAMEKVKQAKIILQVIDVQDNKEEIMEQLDLVQINRTQHRIVLLNKTDQIGKQEAYQKLEEANDYIPGTVVAISAKDNETTNELYQLLIKVTGTFLEGAGEIMITNSRHHEALSLSLTAIKRLKSSIARSLPGDLLAMDIREVLNQLSKITGEITDDEILGNIFKNFCIGK